ncbi:MAG: ligand-binding receptor [Nitrospirae bacterium]|nr:MAG: ligand-binding receptor [Nitrospirota bacterium]
MSTALSGPAADLGRNMLLGVRAGLARANRAGGIHGCRLRLVALDDGYEPARTAPNMRRLVDEEGVLAVVGNVGTPTAVAALPIADEARCLLFAPFTGAGVLRRTPPDRYVINVRASYAEETAAMVEALAAAGVAPERVAFFTQRDAYGDAGYAGGIAALRRHGLGREAAVVHTRYERNTVAVENAVADLLLADPEPQAVIMVGAYAPCARFIRLVEAAGMDPLFLNVSFVGSASLARELGETRARVVVTQVVPHPEDTSLPLVRDYRRDLARLERGAAPTFVSLEGYLAARVLTLALERLPGPPTREGVVEALEGLGDFDLGLGVPLHLDAREHQACHRVWPTLLEAGRFRPFDWAELPALLHRGAGR